MQLCSTPACIFVEILWVVKTQEKRAFPKDTYLKIGIWLVE